MNGIATNVRIMVLRVVPDGDEHDKDVANAIRYAVDNGASIINMSFGKGKSWNKKVVDDAVAHAVKKDVLLIHASGNGSLNTDLEDNFPNDTYEKAKGFLFWKKKQAKTWLEVGALSYLPGDYIVAPFSNYGSSSVDIFAPGMALYSTIPNDEYNELQGTSFSSPITAGVAAVLRSYFPKLKADQVKSIILESATKIDREVVVPGSDERKPFSQLSVSGGILNMYNALMLASKTKGKKKIKKVKTKA
jgi:subtilisin family serine protease